MGTGTPSSSAGLERYLFTASSFFVKPILCVNKDSRPGWQAFFGHQEADEHHTSCVMEPRGIRELWFWSDNRYADLEVFDGIRRAGRSEEHTSELQSPMY